LSYVFKLVNHEIKDMLKNPPIIILVLLPIFMSKIIITVMEKQGLNFLLLSIWILFAQAMIGIMLTGPNLIEEREAKTIDALLVSPLSFGQFIVGKGITSLVCSVFSQIIVITINNGFVGDIKQILLFVLLGGIIYVQIGLIIGLKINSSKTGSAVSSVIFIALFMVSSVYQSFPEWSYKFFAIIPSIEIVSNFNSILNKNGLLLTETLLLVAWIIGLTLWIKKIGKDYY
jgi:ABC-2 type transport system permease protein